MLRVTGEPIWRKIPSLEINSWYFFRAPKVTSKYHKDNFCEIISIQRLLCWCNLFSMISIFYHFDCIVHKSHFVYVRWSSQEEGTKTWKLCYELMEWRMENWFSYHESYSKWSDNTTSDTGPSHAKMPGMLKQVCGIERAIMWRCHKYPKRTEVSPDCPGCLRPLVFGVPG